MYGCHVLISSRTSRVIVESSRTSWLGAESCRTRVEARSSHTASSRVFVRSPKTLLPVYPDQDHLDEEVLEACSRKLLCVQRVVLRMNTQQQQKSKERSERSA
jgi:hypothetical protein